MVLCFAHGQVGFAGLAWYQSSADLASWHGAAGTALVLPSSSVWYEAAATSPAWIGNNRSSVVPAFAGAAAAWSSFGGGNPQAPSSRGCSPRALPALLAAGSARTGGAAVILQDQATRTPRPKWRTGRDRCAGVGADYPAETQAFCRGRPRADRHRHRRRAEAGGEMDGMRRRHAQL